MRGQSTQVVAGAVIVPASVASVAACGGADGPGRPSSSTLVTPASPRPSGTTSTTIPSTTTPSTPTAATTLKSIPVYYVAESQRSFKLYRAFRTVPDTGGTVASAVSAMTRLAPLDTDYMTPWRPASRITVQQTGNNVAVDLSADAFANTNLGSEVAASALQQLIYTATVAAPQSGTPATSVTITRDGKPADVWGALRIGTATKRAVPLEVQAQAWITAPQEGGIRRAGKVTFTGLGASFEATFGWTIRTAAGIEVARGSTMGGTGTGGFGALSFSSRLGPGIHRDPVHRRPLWRGGQRPSHGRQDFTVK